MNNKYEQIIDQAYKLQKLNKLQEAKNLYKKLLGVCFDNIKLFVYYAQLHVSLNDYNTAIEYFHKALTLDENNFDILFNLSISYKMNKNIEQAIVYALKAYDIKFDDCNNLINLAGLYSLKNEIEPEFFYLSKAAFLTNNPDFFYRCGLLANKANNTDLAIEFFQKVLEIDANRTDAMTQIAIIYVDYDKQVAIEMFKELLKNNPTNEFYLFNLAYLHDELELFKDSLKYSQKLVELYPNDYTNYSMLSLAYSTNNMLNEAVEYAKKAYEIDPTNINNAVAYVNRLSTARREEEALNIISKFEDNPKMEREKMEIIMRKRDFENGKELYYKVHSKMASIDKINENLKYHFKMNDGFNKYKMNEERFLQNSNYTETDIYKNRLNFKEKELANNSFENKRVIVYAQHGAGDIIMCARYFHLIKDKVSDFFFAGEKSLQRLFEYNFPNLKYNYMSEKIDKNSYDYATPELCLIYNLGMNFYNIPFSEGYLKVDEKIINEKKILLDKFSTNKRKIGIYWQGNPMILKNRSIRLNNLLPIINDERNQVFSFQMSDVDKESEALKNQLNLIDLAPYITDYMDTAAFLKNIDILITIDTSIAHLAGAIGVKTILMLPYDSEWRWFDDTDTTPWYDSVKIFKQSSRANWLDVVNRIMEYLEKENESKI